MTALLLLSRSVCRSQKFISGKVAGGLGTCHPCHALMLPNTALLFPGTRGSPPPGAEGSPGRDPGRPLGAVGVEGGEGKEEEEVEPSRIPQRPGARSFPGT